MRCVQQQVSPSTGQPSPLADTVPTSQSETVRQAEAPPDDELAAATPMILLCLSLYKGMWIHQTIRIIYLSLSLSPQHTNH